MSQNSIFIKFLSILTTLIVFSEVSAQDPFIIQDDFESSNLTGHLNVFTDISNQKKINEIQHSKFEKYNKETVNFESQNSMNWLNFSIKSKANKDINLVLDIDIVYAQNINFYVFENEKVVSKFENYSWKTGIKSKIISTRYFAFPIKIKAGENLKVIFSIQAAKGNLYAPVTLFEKKAFDSQYEKFNLYYYFPIICIVLASFLTIILFFIFRVRLLIFYFLYQFGFLLYSLNVEGVFAAYFPGFLKENFLYVLGINLANIGNLLFCNSFLLSKMNLKISNVLKIIIYIIVVLSILWCLRVSLLPFNEKLARISTLLSVISFILILTIAIIGLLAKVNKSRIYFIAIFPPVFTSLFLRAVILDFVNINSNYISNDLLYLSNYYAPFLEILILGISQLYFFKKENLDLQNQINRNQESIIISVENERKLIAQDLHDDLGATLAILNSKGKSEAFSEENQRLIKKAIKDLRNISHNLIPVDFELLGLIPSLEKYISNLNETDSVKFTLITYGKNVVLNTDSELNIYRIITELANNVIKHSGAKNATIQLIYHPTYLFVSIEDDGNGLKISENNLGIGLKNVFSRIEYLQAKILDFGSGPSCSFVFEVPYDPNKPK